MFLVLYKNGQKRDHHPAVAHESRERVRGSEKHGDEQVRCHGARSRESELLLQDVGETQQAGNEQAINSHAEETRVRISSAEDAGICISRPQGGDDMAHYFIEVRIEVHDKLEDGHTVRIVNEP